MSYAIFTHHNNKKGGLCWEVAHYIENMGVIPVIGSGPTIKATLPELTHGKERWAIPSIPTLTQEERDSFVKTHYPYTWQAEQSAQIESFDSASL